MKRYTLYNTNDNTVVATNKKWPTSDGVSDPPGLQPGLVLLEEISITNPPYDPATQKLGSWGDWVYDVGAKTATRTVQVLTLTAEELSAMARTAQREAIADSWKTQVPSNIRVHYEHLYLVANGYLDKGDDDAALLIVQEADPIQAVANDPTRLATFNTVKADLITAIQGLSA